MKQAAAATMELGPGTDGFHDSDYFTQRLGWCTIPLPMIRKFPIPTKILDIFIRSYSPPIRWQKKKISIIIQALHFPPFSQDSRLLSLLAAKKPWFDRSKDSDFFSYPIRHGFTPALSQASQPPFEIYLFFSWGFWGMI